MELDEQNKRKLPAEKYIGQKFGKLTILSVERIGSETMCDCVCECGKMTHTYVSKVIHGEIASCGCMRGVRHGEHGTRLYRIWQGMKNRCRNPKMANYSYYGGKGITYTPEWESFQGFSKWAKANGYADNLTIDRIDVNGDYCPENCRWVDWSTQCRNKTSNVYIQRGNERYCLTEFCELFNLSYSAIETAFQRGKLTVEDIAKKAPDGLSLNEYQSRAMSTCMDSCDNHAYMLTGFVGEVGELFGKLAKGIRKEKTEFVYNNLSDGFSEQEKQDIKSELGDCAWFVAGIAQTMGWTFEDICRENLDKLASRKERGVISGDGDNR